MYAVQPGSQTLPPSPSPSNGSGPERTDHATAARGDTPVERPEPPRPAAAPERSERSAEYTENRPRAKLPEPASARAETVIAALSAGERPAPASQAAPESDQVTPVPDPEPQPDPMVPPVPMRYLSELMKPAEQTAPVVQSSVPDDVADKPSAVESITMQSARAEAGSSLDILR